MIRVAVLGAATQDHILHHGAPGSYHRPAQGEAYWMLEVGRKIDLDTLCVSVGGGGVNAAVALHRLGCDVSVCCKLGRDAVGQAVCEAMAARGLRTQHVCHTDAAPTGMAFVLPSPEGDRTVLAHRGANTLLCPHDVPDGWWSSHDVLYLASLSGASARYAPVWARQAAEAGMRVAMNPGVSQLAAGVACLQDALSHVNVLIVNSEEAGGLMAAWGVEPDPRRSVMDPAWPVLLRSAVRTSGITWYLPDFLKQVRARGPSVVVVTHGADGMYWADEQGVGFCPSVVVPVVNTLGAGDALGATLVACWARDLPLNEAACRAVDNSASVVGAMDTHSGLLTWDVLCQRALRLDAIQRFEEACLS